MILIIYLLRGFCESIDIHVFGSGKPYVVILGGVHGNEPSGCVALSHIINQLNDRSMKLVKGTLVIIPCANKCGIWWDSRYVPFRIMNRDLNRNFPSKPFGPSKCILSEKIIGYVNGADWIFDIHEGWGYHSMDKNSMGSTIVPVKSTVDLSNKIIDHLNKKIENKNKKFMIYSKEDIKKGTLRVYCDTLKKKYILMETTGQKNVQPINLRKEQVKMAVYLFLKEIKMLNQ